MPTLISSAVSLQASLKGWSGAVSLELLMQYRNSAAATDTIKLSGAQEWVLLENAYRKHHPVLKFLSTKLAECQWIGENDELGFPDKQDPAKCSISELNDTLHKYVVSDRNGCSLHTCGIFGCLEWESEWCTGVMQARCYPFNMPKCLFHNMNSRYIITCETKVIS